MNMYITPYKRLIEIDFLQTTYCTSNVWFISRFLYDK